EIPVSEKSLPAPARARRARRRGGWLIDKAWPAAEPPVVQSSWLSAVVRRRWRQGTLPRPARSLRYRASKVFRRVYGEEKRRSSVPRFHSRARVRGRFVPRLLQRLQLVLRRQRVDPGRTAPRPDFRVRYGR